MYSTLQTILFHIYYYKNNLSSILQESSVRLRRVRSNMLAVSSAKFCHDGSSKVSLPGLSPPRAGLANSIPSFDATRGKSLGKVSNPREETLILPSHETSSHQLVM